MPEDKLKKLIREKVDHGFLPAVIITTAGGISSGSTCAACNEPINCNSTEMEINRDQTTHGLLLHPICLMELHHVLQERNPTPLSIRPQSRATEK